MRIERENTVALVIDYQEKLVPVMDEKERLIQNSSILLAGLKHLGVPMIVTQQYTKGLGILYRKSEKPWKAMTILIRFHLRHLIL